MYLFFYGDSQFLLERKLNELKHKYLNKAGGNLNLITLDGESISAEDFLTQAQIVPLLASSRLIVVKNIFKCRRKNALDTIKNFLPKIPPSTIVVFTHIGKIDKRLGLYRALIGSKNAHRFEIMDTSAQKVFARREIEKRGATIDPKALELLVDYCQGDMFALSHEIEKLSLYCQGGTITADDVELLVSQAVSADIFILIDKISGGDKRGALLELKKLYQNGEPGLRILAMINYQYRLIAQVKEVQEKTANPFQASKLAGLSYFQVKKTFEVARRISWPELFKVYSHLVSFDEGIKTGKIDEEEGIKELVLVL